MARLGLDHYSVCWCPSPKRCWAISRHNTDHKMILTYFYHQWLRMRINKVWWQCLLTGYNHNKTKHPPVLNKYAAVQTQQTKYLLIGCAAVQPQQNKVLTYSIYCTTKQSACLSDILQYYHNKTKRLFIGYTAVLPQQNKVPVYRIYCSITTAKQSVCLSDILQYYHNKTKCLSICCSITNKTECLSICCGIITTKQSNFLIIGHATYITHDLCDQIQWSRISSQLYFSHEVDLFAVSSHISNEYEKLLSFFLQRKINVINKDMWIQTQSVQTH